MVIELGKVPDLVRTSDWWAYKIPPLLAIAYAGCILFDLPPAAWPATLTVLVAIVLVAVFGYVLNDLCDIEADRLSGRRNRMADVGSIGRTAALALPVAGVFLIAGTIGDTVIAGLLALNLLLPTLYSVPPFRLKGRGAWGAILDAGGVHLLPALLVARSVTMSAHAVTEAVPLFIAAIAGWTAFTGLRGIVLHQVADHDADQRAGVRTFVGAIGIRNARRLVLYGLLPLELGFLSILLYQVLPQAPLVGLALFLFGALEITKRLRGWIQPTFEAASQSREIYRPFLNNQLYEVWLPFALALQLAWLHREAWLVVALQLILFHGNLRRCMADIVALVGEARRSDDKPAESRSRAPQVIIGATTWTVNGVNVFSANLARGLVAAGVDAKVLLTEEGTDLIQTRERAMPFPGDVPFDRFPLHRTAGWGAHWGAMVRYLESAAPCVYIPNSDWRHSCVCPRLSDKVIVAGVVHSDDPLHYDHVRRLGPYWNIVVAVSNAVASRTLEICPEVADRLVTIPIGVRIPDTQAERSPSTSVLRLIYHGILKQHQKRVLDLPKIVAAADTLGVPVELTIVGAGPDEEALRAAAAPLVERGLIRFHGVVSPEEIGPLLERFDVYLLASEFEGMPNALIEAMGRGCVPVVSRMESGIPELVKDGENGFLAPIGDAGQFAERLRALWADPAMRARLAKEAYRSVREGGFRVEEMVEAYRKAFERAADDVRTGRYRRPPGPLLPPPAEVAGVSLFPVPLPYALPEVGDFPSIDDAEDYQEQIRAVTEYTPAVDRQRKRIREAAARVSLDRLKVFVSAPVWTSNGVNSWAEDVVRGLRQAGLDARLLLTEESTRLVQIDEPRLLRPTDIPIDELKIAGTDNWGARWGAMIRLLESAAPCVYFPTYDWRHSCVVPALSDRVIVIGSLHDGSPEYLEHAARLGEYWNATIATDRRTIRQARAELPALRDRLAMIPHGFNLSPTGRRGGDYAAPVALLLGAGSGQHAGWLLHLAGELAGGHASMRILAVAPSPDVLDGLAAMGAETIMRPNRYQWHELCDRSHFVIAADSDGQNARLIVEAMSRGCIPLISPALAEGWPALRNAGAIVATDADGDLGASLLAPILSDRSVAAELADRAQRFAAEAGYTGLQMTDALIELLRDAIAQASLGIFRRKRGPILPPPPMAGDLSIFPVTLTHRDKSGRFPSAADAACFRAEAATGGAFRSRKA